MKTAKLILLLVFFTSTNLLSQIDKTKDTDPFTLEEKEKKIRSKNNISESFEYRYDVKTRETMLSKHKTYNKSGFLLKYVFFLSSKRDTTILDTYKYKGDTLIKKCNDMKFDDYQVTYEFKSYSYDKKGNKIEIQTINQNGKKGYQKIIYNSKNQKIALYEQWLDQNKFSIVEKNNYSKKNNLILSSKKYSENGNLYGVFKYEYDNLDNLVCQYLLTQGIKNNFTFYSYDENNFLIERIYKIPNIKTVNDIYRIKYEYDTDYNIIKEYFSVNDILISINTITYKKFE